MGNKGLDKVRDSLKSPGTSKGMRCCLVFSLCIGVVLLMKKDFNKTYQLKSNKCFDKDFVSKAKESLLKLNRENNSINYLDFAYMTDTLRFKGIEFQSSSVYNMVYMVTATELKTQKEYNIYLSRNLPDINIGRSKGRIIDAFADEELIISSDHHITCGKGGDILKTLLGYPGNTTVEK